MRRRSLLTGLLCSAVMLPKALHAQRPEIPVIGFLAPQSLEPPFLARLAAFHEGLDATGYEEGRNLTIQYRWGEGHYDRLPGLAVELAEMGVSAIFATGGNEAALAARDATTTIPVVFIMGDDPVEIGLIESLRRPGGNVTGFTTFGSVPDGKRLQLLHEIVPSAATIDVLLDQTMAGFAGDVRGLEAAALVLGLPLRIHSASNEAEADVAFAAMARSGARALLVQFGSSFVGTSLQGHILALAMANGIATMHGSREGPIGGGLVSYGVDLPALYRQAGSYVGRILNGESPADLPVVEPTTFEFVINLRTAVALGIEISPEFLAIATEILE